MEPKATFLVENGWLMEIEKEPWPNQLMYTVVTGRRKQQAKGKQFTYVVGLACHEVGITAGVKWKDGAMIFSTSTAKIRRMLSDKKIVTHVGLMKWERSTKWSYREESM
jgi:hypothetical protein